MNMCSKCHSRQSQVTCDDCSEKFCNQCYSDHQRDLTDKYQQLCCQIDFVKELLNSFNSTNVPNKSHELIVQWEQRMYQEVSNTASKLHHQLDERTRNVVDDIRPGLNKITTEMNLMRKIESYIERDIYQIKQQLFEIETKLKQLNDIVEIDETKLRKLDLSSSIRFNDRKIVSSESTTHHSQNQNISTLKEQGTDRFWLMLDFFIFISFAEQIRSDSRINYHRRHSTQVTNMAENNYRPPSVRHQASRQRLYQCICCKQMNVYYENQENRCQTCKSVCEF